MLMSPMPSQVIQENGSKEVSDALSKLIVKEVKVTKLKICISKEEEEISKLQEHVKNKEQVIVEVENTKSQIEKNLDQAMKKLACQNFFPNFLIVAKHVLRHEIIAKISRFWNHLVVLQDEEILVGQTQHVINKLCNELGDKPQIVYSVIKFPNSRSKSDLKEMGINDGIEIIMESSKVQTKRTMGQ